MEKSNKDFVKKFAPAAVIVLCLIVLFALHGKEWMQQFKDNLSAPARTSPVCVTVHFIDVGQGASTLIQDGKNGILIDAGEAECADAVISYIRNCGVTTLKYVIATHPHSDHIGAMAEVINTFGAETVLIPKLQKSQVPTSACYTYFLKAAQSKGAARVFAVPGAEYTFGRHVRFTVLGPVKRSDDMNNMSIVCRMKIFGTRFIFPGDAGSEELKTIMNTGADVACDVMLMAHHGSNTSEYGPYLDAAAPRVAVISCGKNNEYGHPHEEILRYLKQNKIEIHRTDKEGTIVIRVGKDGYAFAKAA